MKKKTFQSDTLYHLFSSPLATIGVTIIVALILVALTANLLAPYPEDAGSKIKLGNRLLPPSSEHIFGTDEMGRDILSRILFGTRISLRIGVIVVSISLVIGTTLGALAGFFGGICDDIIMRITDVFLAVPQLVLALAIAGALGPSLNNAMLALGLAWWPWYTRLVRGQVLSIREQQYIEAARSIGVKPMVIIWRHVIINCLPPILVQASMDMGYTILSAASLGFLGLGAQPPLPEWGLMVNQGREFFPNWWWVATWPGLAIFITVMGFNLLGDGLRHT